MGQLIEVIRAHPPAAGDYNGAGFWLAGQALAKQLGTATLWLAMKSADGFFRALGVKRAKTGHAHPEAALADPTQALCHGHPGYQRYAQPLVEVPPGSGNFVYGAFGPSTYAGWLPVAGVSVGTWCMAAVDLARIFSCWDLDPNPLFDAANQWKGEKMLLRFAMNTGMGVYSYPESMSVESPPTTVQHNGAIAGGIAMVMRRRFSATTGFAPKDSFVVALMFNSTRSDGASIYYEIEGETLFQLAKLDAAIHGWPSWNLFSEVDLPGFSA